MDLTMTLQTCRLMVSRMHLADTDGAVWLFPASAGAATLVGVVHLTKPSRPRAPGGHSLAAVFARVIWSLATELTGLPTAVAVLFPCGAGRVLEVAGVALRFLYGPGPTVEGGPMHLSRDESVAAALLAHARRIDVLLLDDWGLASLSAAEGREILEVLEDRTERRGTIVTTQVPVDGWHDLIANPTVADAILDRLVHNAHKLQLKGESMRKIRAKRDK